MTGRIFFIKLVHTVIYFYMSACLLYILYAGIARAFSWILILAVCSILVEGVVLLLNRWRCPFTVWAERLGAVRGSVTDIFLPDIIARNTFKFSTVLFALELVLLAVRYFLNI